MHRVYGQGRTQSSAHYMTAHLHTVRLPLDVCPFPYILRACSKNLYKMCKGYAYAYPIVRTVVVYSYDVTHSVLQCVAVCCSVLQCVAVCCNVLQCVAVCCSVLHV